MTMKNLLMAVAAAGLLGACAMGTDYRRPAVSAPEAFRGAPALAGKPLADMAWWEIYRDPALDALLQIVPRHPAGEGLHSQTVQVGS